MNPTRPLAWLRVSLCLFAAAIVGGAAMTAETPFLQGEFLQPPDPLHNHGLCVVETPGGDLLACWFYPSLIPAKDGTLHATYSYTIAKSKAVHDAAGRPARETIKRVHFNEAWILAGDP